MGVFKGIVDHFKKEIQLTKEYYGISDRNEPEIELKESETLQYAQIKEDKPVKPKHTKPTAGQDSSVWPYDNNINITSLSREEQREREQRIEVCMEAYPFLPFSIGPSKLYRPNTSWKILNLEEQSVVKLALQEMNKLVAGCYGNENVLEKFLPKGLSIPYEKVSFGFPLPMKENSTPGTFVEYKPLTNAGKQSKTPLVVHYTTIDGHISFYDNECHGDLSYGLDGKVCKATAYIFKNNHCYTYEFGLIGRTFVVTKISTKNKETGKNILIYNSNWEYILY